MSRQIKLVTAPAPVVEIPGDMPTLPLEVYEQRLSRLRARMEERGLDYVVIYADREHAANFAYLTGFGPRFEEALLIVGQSGALGCFWAPRT